MTDEELWGKWRAGDESAFNALYEKYRSYVRAIARDRGKPCDVEDISQIAWLSFLKYADRRPANMKIQMFVQLHAIYAASRFYKKPGGAQRLAAENLDDREWAKLTVPFDDSREREAFAAMTVGKIRSLLGHTIEGKVFEGVFVENRSQTDVGKSIGLRRRRVNQILGNVRLKVYEAFGLVLPRFAYRRANKKYAH